MTTTQRRRVFWGCFTVSTEGLEVHEAGLGLTRRTMPPPVRGVDSPGRRTGGLEKARGLPCDLRLQLATATARLLFVYELGRGVHLRAGRFEVGAKNPLGVRGFRTSASPRPRAHDCSQWQGAALKHPAREGRCVDGPDVGLEQGAGPASARGVRAHRGAGAAASGSAGWVRPAALPRLRGCSGRA